MERVVIVHCWGGKPKHCWYPKTKEELEEKGFEVIVPDMPNTDYPQLSEWLPALQKAANKPDENLYLVGHSLGCVTIMRYLETLKEDEKIGGVVLVAGFTDDLNFEELKNFYIKPINFEKIKTKAKHFIIIASDNDPYVPLEYADILEEKLGAKKIIKHAMGHFSGDIDDPRSCTSLPDVSKEIIYLRKS